MKTIFLTSHNETVNTLFTIGSVRSGKNEKVLIEMLNNPSVLCFQHSTGLTPELFNNFSTGVSNVFSNFGNAVTSFVNQVFTVGSTATNQLTDSATGILSTVSGLGAGVLSSASAVLADPVHIVPNIINKTISTINQLATDSGQSVTGLLNSLATLTQSVPRSLMDTSVVVDPILQLSKQLAELSKSTDGKIITPLIQTLSVALEEMTTNLKSLEDLHNVPRAILSAPQTLLDNLNTSVVVVGNIIKDNPNLSTPLNNILNSITELLNSFPALLQSATNTITTVALDLQNAGITIVDQIQLPIQSLTDSLTNLTTSISKKLDSLFTTSRESIETVLKATQVSITTSSASVKNLTSQLNAVGLSTRQTHSALMSLNNATTSASTTIISQLEALIRNTKSLIPALFNPVSKSIPQSFQQVTTLVYDSFSKGNTRAQICLKDIQDTTTNTTKATIGSLMVCARRIANDTETLVSNVVTDVKSTVTSVGELADQLSNCSKLNSFSVASQTATTTQTVACMAEVLFEVRENQALNSLTALQNQITSLSLHMPDTITTCTGETKLALENEIKTIHDKAVFCLSNWART